VTGQQPRDRHIEAAIARAADAIEAEAERLAEPISKSRAYVLARAALSTVGPAAPLGARTPAGDLYGLLSARHLQLLKLTARGLTYEEMGRVLDLSEKTVKVHVRSMLKRMGVHNRMHALALGFVHGLVTAEDVFEEKEQDDG
jgi:DNA-binding NarL/FixJ family response regulator